MFIYFFVCVYLQFKKFKKLYYLFDRGFIRLFDIGYVKIKFIFL